MNILYVCADYGIPVLGSKGASIHVREMIAALRRAGHAVALAAPVLTKSPWEEPAAIAATLLHLPLDPQTLASVHALGEYAEELGADNGLARDCRRILYDQQLRGQLLRKFTKSPPDLIYARASLYTVAPVALARAIGRPLLVELNAPLAEEHERYRNAADHALAARTEQELLRGADAVLTVSEGLRAHASDCGAPAERVHVLPNAVDPARFRPADRDAGLAGRLGLQGGPVIGFVGGLRPWHGVEIMPALLERLAARHPQLRMLIVGTGPLRAKLEAEFAQRGLAGRAVFVGSVAHDAVPDLTRLMDIALAPYPRLDHLFYFSPLKLFEYMGCGIPVVASRVGQIQELVRDGETGLLCEAGSLEQLAERCQRLLDSPELRGEIGRAAARQVHEHHTWDHNAARVMAIARPLIEKGTPQ